VVLCIGVRPKIRRPYFDGGDFLPSEPNRNRRSLPIQGELFYVIIDLAADDFKSMRQQRMLEFKTIDGVINFIYFDPEKHLDLHELLNLHLTQNCH
jgi:hypothetical protein